MGTPPMRRRVNDPERPLEPRESAPRHCPVCGAEEPEKIIQEPGGAVLGCDECLRVYDAWDWFERQEEEKC